MDSLKTAKVITVTTAIFFGVCFSWLVYSRHENARLHDELDSEKLRSEALLSEKRLLEESILTLEDLLRQARDSVSLAKKKYQLQLNMLSRKHDIRRNNDLSASIRTVQLRLDSENNVSQ